MLSGNTILHAGLRAYASVAPTGAGTQLDVVGSATVIFDFTVTDPVSAAIQSNFSTDGTTVGGYLESRVAMTHDGQFVAGWGLNVGEAYESMNWEFDPGAWEITAFADVDLSTGPSRPAQQGEALLSLEITSVPGPGGLAVVGVVVLLGVRRRR